MKKQWVTTVVAIAMVLGMFTGSANAADKYSSAAAITWATGTNVWSTSSGGPYTGPWNSGDSAIFERATGGGVTLGESISVSNITFTGGNYTISGQTLNFVSGGTIDHADLNTKQTITSAITGSPDVRVADGTSSSAMLLNFEPVSGSVDLGAVTLAYEGSLGGNAVRLTLGGGATTTNTAVSITNNPAHWYCVVYKIGASTWTVGKLDVGFRGYTYLNDGILIANGAIGCRRLQVFSPAQLHINNATMTVADNLEIHGGSLDNSSGSAIVSQTNPTQLWGGDWTFIGSGGTLSDLDLGTGAVTLNANRTVTVDDSDTTLTVGGVISDGTPAYSLTKAGDGTLDLTGNNTYNGNTTVADGTLKIAYPYLDDVSIISVSNGATLYLDFTGTDTVGAVFLDGASTAAGTWGGPLSPAGTKTNLFAGTGVLVHSGGLAPANTWFWDGPNYGGNGNIASDGGTGNWSPSSTNWDEGLGPKVAWPNTTNALAIFRTSSGTVDLQSNITLGEILIDGVDNYQIGDNTETYSLNFGGAKKITVDQVTATIKAGITGSPDIYTLDAGAEALYLTPEVDMTIGDIYPMGNVYLSGSTTNNSASSIQAAYQWRAFYKNGASAWTVGDVANFDRLELNDGRLVINGTKYRTIRRNRSGILWTGAATLAGTGTIDDPAENYTALTVPAIGTLAPGDPTGTLTVTNDNCTIDGTLAITIDGASYSTLAVDPAYTLTIGAAAILDVNVTSASGPVVIATYGTLAGNPFPTENIPDGWMIDYEANGGTAITLSPSSTGTVFAFR